MLRTSMNDPKGAYEVSVLDDRDIARTYYVPVDDPDFAGLSGFEAADLIIEDAAHNGDVVTDIRIGTDVVFADSRYAPLPDDFDPVDAQRKGY